ncbi:MAG: ABC transporter permease [Zoogloeaceae bacterium]|jgi:phospholipid/cholesterol/gamma-HCH transport system permease protein|nr:ABC transporter permease [Zoogloeaceae bacterium]
MNTPSLEIDDGIAVLRGEWTLSALSALGALARGRADLLAALDRAGKEASGWNLDGVTRLDSAAALLLWRHWHERFPAGLSLPESLRPTLERVVDLSAAGKEDSAAAPPCFTLVERIGLRTLAVIRPLLHFLAGLVELFGALVLALLFLCRVPRAIPWKEISANIYKAGFEALPVSALVGFLIGMTISYLSALQLKTYGADIFIVNLLGIGIIRELGPVLAAILVAGRSGSAMTAQIGVMRVTEEIDALATLGISSTLRVVFPKVAALFFVMPLLVLWVCVAALMGGALAAYWELDLPLRYFLHRLPEAVPVANLWISLCKGATFGFLIALLACQFGLHVRPNTESLSRRTTASVVTAITLVILVDAIFAILTRHLGMP